MLKRPGKDRAPPGGGFWGLRFERTKGLTHADEVVGSQGVETRASAKVELKVLGNEECEAAVQVVFVGVLLCREAEVLRIGAQGVEERDADGNTCAELIEWTVDTPKASRPGSPAAIASLVLPLL